MAEAEGRREKDLDLVEEFETVRAVTSDGRSVRIPKSKIGGNLETATETVLGGIKAAAKTEKETVEAKIDHTTGKLFVPKGGSAPDDEDITLAEIEGEEKLQFKDKLYNASTYSGLGRKYLRKNMVDGVNVLAQSFFTNDDGTVKSNTRYIIQYDYDLNGATITIPEGCVLVFQGGSLSNGVLIGDDTNIEADKKAVFYNIIIQGSWIIADIYSKWFKDIKANNVLKQLFNLSNENIQTRIYIDKGDYTVSATSTDYNVLNVNSNTEVHLEGTISLQPNDLDTYAIISIIKAENVSIVGSGYIVGDRDSHTGSTGESGMGIDISGSKNVVISGLTIHNCWGDSIYIGGWNGVNQNITIKDFHFYNNRRQGISITWGNNITITDGKIHDISGTSPYACIDLEPNTGCVVSNVSVNKVEMSNERGIFILPGADNYNTIETPTRDVSITDCSINGNFLLWIGTSYNVKVTGTKFISNEETEAIEISGRSFDNMPYCFERCYFDTPNTTLFKETNSILKVSSSVIVANNLIKVGYQNQIHDEFVDCNITLGRQIDSEYVKLERCNVAGGAIICYGKGFILLKNKITKKIENTAIEDLLYLRGDCVVDGNEFVINGSITNKCVINSHEGVNVIINNKATLLYPDEWNDYSALVGGTLDGCSVGNNMVSDSTKRVYNASIEKALVGGEHEVRTGLNTERPIVNLSVGRFYFDKTLGKPIWYTGTTWVDATGIEV